MMIIDLKINNLHLYSIQVVRVDDLESKDQVSTYTIEGLSGKTVKHKYSDGAVKLAIKALKALDKSK